MDNQDNDGSQPDREMNAIVERLEELETSELEHARAGEQERLRTRELQALFDVAGILVQPGSFETKASRALETLAFAVQAEWVALRIFDEEVNGLRLVAAIGSGLENAPPVPVLSGGQLMSGIAFEQGEPVVVNDYPSYPNADPARVAHGIKSAISLLLRADGRAVGSLNVNSKEYDHFTPERVRFLSAISDGLGVLMDNANLAAQAQNREELYRMLFENSNDAVYIERHGTVLDMNQAALDMFGMSLEEALAFPANDFFVDPDVQIRFGQALDATGSTKDFEAKLYKKDGTEIDCLFTATIQLSRDDPRSTTQGIIRDVTEQKGAERALRESEEEALRLAHENAVMAEIGRIISASLNIDDVYDGFAEEVRKLVPFDRIDVTLADVDEGIVTHAYWTGLEASGRHKGDMYSLKGTATEEICRTSSGILFHPEDGEQVAKRFPGLLPAFNSGLRSFVGSPLVSGNLAIGGLFLASTQPNAYTERDLELTQRVGSEIAGAIANAQLYAELMDAQKTVRELAVLEERNRMAREIHDTMAQGFTGIVLQLEAAEQAFEEAPAELPDHLDRAKTLARECLQEARRSVWDLLLRALEERTLAEALREEVRKFASEGPTRADLRVSGTVREIFSHAQTALLRICQESLTNVRKHARATEVELHLEFDSESIRLSISDNGVGIQSGGEGEEIGGDGFGIKGMEQRAKLLSGVLKVSKGINKGTKIEVTIPID